MTECQFLELDYPQFIFLYEMIAEMKAEARKENLIAASFTAWQLQNTRKSFADYLIPLGLSDKSNKMTPEMRKKIAAKNVAIAERIRKSSLKRRGLA